MKRLGPVRYDNRLLNFRVQCIEEIGMETIAFTTQGDSVDLASEVLGSNFIAPVNPHNYCTTCNKDFGSVRAFDRHRVGKYQYPYSAEHPDGRRCLSTDEMSRDEFVLNSRDLWTLESSLRSAQKFAENTSAS